MSGDRVRPAGPPRPVDVPGEAAAAPAVRVAGVTFSYEVPPSAAPVLRGCSVDLAAGEVSAILGPNGVGKTTLLNVLLGWLRPDAGSVELFGTPIARMSRREMGRTVSLVPQEEHIPFEFSVLDYVLLGRAPYLSPLEVPHPADRDRALAALERAGMAAAIEKQVTAISGGEKQLLMLARSLCQEPRLLVLDEPSAHLDIRNKRRLVAVLDELRVSGTTIVLSTHDPEFAAVAADRLVLMKDGRAAAVGPPREVLTEPLLTAVYGTPVTVFERDGHPVVLW